MKIKIASTIRIRQSWLDEVIAFVPGVVFEVVRTKELITTHYRPEWSSQYGNFADVRRIVNATDVYARVYIMSHGQLRRLGITNHLALYDNADRDGILDTYISLDTKLDARAKANGFNSNFAWLIVHELTHGREQNIGREYLAVDGDRTHEWEAQGRLKELWATTSLIEVLKAKVAYLIAMLKSISMPDTLFHPVQFKPLMISQVYGIASSRYPRTGRHIGTDYAIPIGTPLYAPWAGKVTTSGTTATLGNFCHYEYTFNGQKWEERWCHLNAVPKLGAYKRGDRVAISGNTGQSTGPHLHREKWIDDVRIDLITKLNWANLTVDPENIIWNSQL